MENGTPGDVALQANATFPTSVTCMLDVSSEPGQLQLWRYSTKYSLNQVSRVRCYVTRWMCGGLIVAAFGSTVYPCTTLTPGALRTLRGAY